MLTTAIADSDLFCSYTVCRTHLYDLLSQQQLSLLFYCTPRMFRQIKTEEIGGGVV